ncbi:MAG: hypothetical protein SGJ27_16670 [Candidatus Melainabacteria bacterium]|nr:hypothetical protein [Candidatus Melainabacteria bacterium]
MRLAAISLLLLVFILSPAEASGIGLKATLEKAPPHSVKLFKGLELYMWRVDDKPHWSMLMGTNRNKTKAEIRRKEETIKSVDEITRLLEKVAPGEYIILVDQEKAEGKKNSREEISTIKAVCKKLNLNFLGDT